jgi:hypothetical protein
MLAGGCLVLSLASLATAQLLFCLSEPELPGEHTVAQGVKAGHKSVFMTKHGIAAGLPQEEMELTLAFRPMLANLQTFGMENAGQSARIRALSRIGGQLP